MLDRAGREGFVVRPLLRDVRDCSLVALALTACVLTVCSGDEDPTPHPQVTASDPEVRLEAPDDADLVLYVSDHSFEDETVRLKLAVDGVTVVDGEFRVDEAAQLDPLPQGSLAGAAHPHRGG